MEQRDEDAADAAAVGSTSAVKMSSQPWPLRTIWQGSPQADFAADSIQQR